MKKSSLIICIAFLLLSCNLSKEKINKEDICKIAQKEIAVDTLDSYVLMKTNCYICHNPNTISHDSIIAPPFVAIKRRYSMQYSNKEDFVAAVVNWGLNPDEEKALMRGAVMEYKVMPKLYLEANVLEKIATYLYENEVEQPKWFETHFEEMHGQGQGMGKGIGRRMNKNNKN